MKPAVKRIVIKATVLTLALHGFVLYTQYSQHGAIPSAVWSKLGFTFLSSVLLIAGMGWLLNRVLKDEPVRRGQSRK